MTVRDLAKQQSELCKKLAGFRRSDAIAATAGLLLEARNHAFQPLIESLLLLIATHAVGEAKPTLKDMEGWVAAIAESSVSEQFDPTEDVFATKVCWDDGNRMVLLGGQPHADYWLQTLFLVMHDLPQEGDFATLRQSIRALLRATDAALQSADVVPDQFVGETDADGKVVNGGKSRFGKLAAAGCFSVDRLAELGITDADLARFAFPSEDCAELLDREILESPWRYQPLLRVENGFVLTFTTWAIPAMRQQIFSLLADERNRKVFLGRLRRVQSQEAEGALQRLRCTTIDTVDFPARQKQPFPFRLKRFDVDKAAIAILVVDDATSESMEPHDTDSALSKAVAQLTGDSVAFLAERHGIRGGVVTVIAGGLGSPFHLSCSTPPAGWHYLLFSLPEFVTLSCQSEASFLRYWRYALARDDQESGQDRVFGLGGELSTYAYWRSLHYTFAAKPNPRGGPTFVMVTGDVGIKERAAARKSRGLHSAFHPGLGRWLPVERFVSHGFFENDEKKRIFVCTEAAKHPLFSACIEVGKSTTWLESERTTSKRHFWIIFNLWKCAMQWTVQAAEYIHEKIAPMEHGLFLALEYVDLEQWVPDEAPQPPPEPVAPTTKVRADGAVVLDLVEDFFHAFARPVNSAERVLVATILRLLLERNGLEATLERVDACIGAIVPNEQFRFFHVIPSRNSLVLESGQQPEPLLVSEEVKFNSRRGLAKPGFEAGPIHDEAGAKKALFAAVDVLFERVCKRLKVFSRESVVRRSLQNHAHVDAERKVWSLTSAAVTTIHGQEEAIRVAVEQESRHAESAFGSRLVIEAALVTASTGAQPITDDALERCIADFAVLIEQANQADAIMGKMVAPKLEGEPLGEISYDTSFIDEIVHAYQFDLLGNRYLEQAAGYAEEFNRSSVTAKSPELITFEGAFIAEYGFAVEQVVRLGQAIVNEAAKAPDHVLAWPRSKLSAFIVETVGLSHVDAGRLVDEFRLCPRSGFDRDIPPGMLKTEVYPWVYRRRMSLLWRPFVQIDETEDSTFLLGGDFIRRAVRHRLDYLYRGMLDADRFGSEKMRAYIGNVANKRGAQFNALVLAEVRKLGLFAEAEVELTTLGSPAQGPDGRGWGDVDVLAFDARRKLVHACECKALMEARSVAEIVEQLNSFSGDRDDLLGKHLRRVDWLKHNLATAGKAYGLDFSNCRLKHWIVSSKVVPMQYRQAHNIDYRRFIQFSELKASLG